MPNSSRWTVITWTRLSSTGFANSFPAPLPGGRFAISITLSIRLPDTMALIRTCASALNLCYSSIQWTWFFPATSMCMNELSRSTVFTILFLEIPENSVFTI